MARTTEVMKVQLDSTDRALLRKLTSALDANTKARRRTREVPPGAEDTGDYDLGVAVRTAPPVHVIPGAISGPRVGVYA